MQVGIWGVTVILSFKFMLQFIIMIRIIELVDKSIRDIKLGKDAGTDGIETEHLLYL